MYVCMLLHNFLDSGGKQPSKLHQKIQQHPQWDYNTGMNRKL